MKTLLRLTIASFTALLPLLAQADTVTFANGDWAPYLGKDMPNGGPVTELVTEAFATQGWTVKYDYLPWKRGYELTKLNKLDGSIVWSRTEERAADVEFSEPVIDLDTVIFFNKNKPVTWETPEQLKGITIGGVIGYDYAFITEASGYKLERVGTPDQNYKKLANGRIDAVAEERMVGLQLAKDSGTSEKITFVPKPIFTKPYYLIVGKSHPRHAQIIDTFNKGLAELKAKGRYNQILGKE